MIRTQDDIGNAIRSIKDLYPMLDFTVYKHQENQSVAVCASTTRNATTYKADYVISEEQLLRAYNAEDLVFQALEHVAQEAIWVIPEDVIGVYPFARIWHDLHVSKPLHGTLLFHPEKTVPGFVFAKAKMSNYPQDRSKGWQQNGNPTVKINAKVGQALTTIEQATLETDRIEIEEAIKMAKTTKRKVVRAPIKGFDPTKVKKPECKDHRTPMVFDHVEQKWRCTYEGCNMVARPKRDADDRHVILGKGNVQLRLIAQDGGLSVVLISDDNVALDITEFVSTDEIIDQFDVTTQAKVASGEGKQVFAIPTRKVIEFKSSLMVMGSDELTE